MRNNKPSGSRFPTKPPKSHRHEVMNPDPRLDAADKRILRKQLGYLLGYGRELTELEVEMQLERIRRGGLIP